MRIDRGVRGDQRVDVGDRDQDARGPVAVRNRYRQLVEVARVVVVDRRPEQMAQIAHGSVGRGRGARDRVRLALRRSRKVRLQPALEHHAMCDAAQVVLGTADTLLHAPDDTAGVRDAAAWRERNRPR
jgi:hypothetical protein